LILLDLKNSVLRVNSSWIITWVDLPQKWPKLAEKDMLAEMES